MTELLNTTSKAPSRNGSKRPSPATRNSSPAGFPMDCGRLRSTTRGRTASSPQHSGVPPISSTRALPPMSNSRAKRSMRRRRKWSETEAIAASVSGLAIAAEIDLRVHRELAVGAEIHQVPHQNGPRRSDLALLHGPIGLIQHVGFRARRQQKLPPADIRKGIVDGGGRLPYGKARRNIVGFRGQVQDHVGIVGDVQHAVKSYDRASQIRAS